MANFGGVGELPRLLPCTQGTAAFFVVFPLHFRLGMVDKTRYTTGGSASFEEYEYASEGGEGQKMTCICTPACTDAGQFGREGGPDVECFSVFLGGGGI